MDGVTEIAERALRAHLLDGGTHVRTHRLAVDAQDDIAREQPRARGRRIRQGS
jgi:hypothetical protein